MSTDTNENDTNEDDTNENNMMQETVNRALTVINRNNEWMEYVKNFDDPRGFLFCQSNIVNDIGDAIDEENPIHSGSSIAVCLQQCKYILNNYTL